jgi:arylsulfatase A-like enzyme
MQLRNHITVLLICAAAYTTAAKEQAKPNVLFIAIDDLRPELGCYGDTQVKSPNIDKLASEGMLFSRAYCQVPVCGASRASLMTGILPTAKRFVNYLTRADKDAPTAATLPQVFKGSGYRTISNGKIFHHRDDCQARSWSEPAWYPKTAGFASSFDPATTEKVSKRKRGRIYEHPDVPDNAYVDGKIAEKTIKDLQRLKEGGKPFFLACGFVRPHMPFYAPKQYWDLYEREKVEIAGNRYRPKNAPGALRGSGEFNSYHPGGFEVNSVAWHRMMRHGYFACVSYVDQLVGNVLGELDRLGLADNTIVVIWGDHGWHLGEHNFWGKHNTMHNALRVPLIVKVPGKTSGGKSGALVETLDIFPTLCKLADLSVPASVQGHDFTALLDDPGKAFHNAVYSRFVKGDAVMTERYVYTSYAGGGQMLYDHKKDPGENHNVAGNPENRKIVAKLKKLLDERILEAKGAEF